MCCCCVFAGAALIAVTDGTPSLVKHYPKVTAASPVVIGGEGGTARLALASTSTSSSSSQASLSLQTISLPSGDELSVETIPFSDLQHLIEGPAAAVKKVFLQCPKRSGTSCTAVVTLADHQLLLVKDGAVQWVREEALASLTRTVFMDLPAKGGGGSTGASRGLEGQQQGTGAAAGGGGGGEDGVQQEGGERGVGEQRAWWASVLGVDEGQVKRWVRLQLLSVLVQFKMNTEAEKMELFELRQALR